VWMVEWFPKFQRNIVCLTRKEPLVHNYAFSCVIFAEKPGTEDTLLKNHSLPLIIYYIVFFTCVGLSYHHICVYGAGAVAIQICIRLAMRMMR
jgi:hypothetical protein